MIIKSIMFLDSVSTSVTIKSHSKNNASAEKFGGMGQWKYQD